MELFPKEFVPELTTKNVGNSTSFLIITHMTLSAKWFRKIRNFDDRRHCCILFLDRTTAEWIFNLQTQIGQNSGSPKYHFRWQLSQLFNGPINGSKRLAIYELRQSETRPVAKIIFLADHTYLYKTGFWRNFAMTSPKTLHMKNVANELSFPLVTHMTHFDIRFGRYGISKSCFSSGHVMDRLDCSCSIRFLGHKMGDTC
jgi:hypothetical protein